MTVISKHGLLKKADEANVEVGDDEATVVTPERLFKRITLLVLALTLGLVCVGAVCTFNAYRGQGRLTRYKGFCSVPMVWPGESPAKVALSWSSDPNVQVISASTDLELDDAMDKEMDTEKMLPSALREMFDVDSLREQIVVSDRGRLVNYVHDFELNYTGIIDMERCFIMDLDPDLVVIPDTLLLAIQSQGPFDLTRVRVETRAIVAAVRVLQAREVQRRCGERPVYELRRTEPVRKRSADVVEVEPQYVHFSGKHIQELEIRNFDEIIANEKIAK